MSTATPIYDALVAQLPPIEPAESVLLSQLGGIMWCIVCRDVDHNHEHPDDERAPRIGDEISLATARERRWIQENPKRWSPFTNGARA